MKLKHKRMLKIFEKIQEENKKQKHKKCSYFTDSEIENIDFKKHLELIEKLNQVRGEIIDSVIDLEFLIDVTIRNYLFGKNTKNAQLFEKLILLKLSFSLKIAFLENVIKINKPIYMDETKEWLSKLKSINSIRNYLAHGRQSNDFPLFNNSDTVAEISLFKKIDYSSISLSDKEIEKMEKNITECLSFIGFKLMEEGFKNYFG